jgi:hypothetical protein
LRTIEELEEVLKIITDNNLYKDGTKKEVWKGWFLKVWQ